MTPEQLAALAARLQEPDLAGLGDQQAADALNAQGQGDGTVWIDFPAEDLYVLLLEAGVWGLIELNSRRAPTTALVTAGSDPNNQDILVSRMLTLVRMVQDIPTIRASRSGVRSVISTIFTGLQAAGFVGVGVTTAAAALAQRPAAWWEKPFGVPALPGPLTARDIGLAWASVGGRN